ncbi:DJ-1/PfpI family protein [Kiritimatiellaeota bacterium B1221]|nr:DJ-1/PfpI family protein [Kiritimatiellaeota bacterium B1221]
MKSACVLLAPGCEEMEAVIVIDVLRRGGVEVVAAGLQAEMFEASRGVKITPDIGLDALAEAKEFDLLVLPGGLPGTEALRNDDRVRDLLIHYFQSADKTVGVICAASLVLDAHGLLEGRKFTCYPSTAPEIQGGTWVDERVVTDGNLVSSQGPGTAMAFALKLVERLAGVETRMEVAEGMLFEG